MNRRFFRLYVLIGNDFAELLPPDGGILSMVKSTGRVTHLISDGLQNQMQLLELQQDFF